mmetsp:Transcript_18944/g.47920  ORF Transcript_18944/g.47920 Transcript_18944/m.47920 type:complete len:279 (-) Transcript_18944:95-931(-)
MSTLNVVRKVAQDALFVSEPNPFMFGNGSNPRGNASWTNANWLKSRFHFAFAEYRNPGNSRFGVLRVMNDDLVQPDRGFGAHPHANMEIVTYVVHGELTHKDSMGNQESIPRGSVQFMSAGTGVVHSEFNKSTSEPLRFIQMWVLPRKQNVPVNYGSLHGDLSSRHNKWQHLVSDRASSYKTPIKIEQDANFYVAELDEGVAVDLDLRANRQAYLLCIEGSVSIEATTEDAVCAEKLDEHDASELFGPAHFTFAAEPGGAHVLVVEMEKDGSSRFRGL